MASRCFVCYIINMNAMEHVEDEKTSGAETKDAWQAVKDVIFMGGYAGKGNIDSSDSSWMTSEKMEGRRENSLQKLGKAAFNVFKRVSLGMAGSRGAEKYRAQLENGELDDLSAEEKLNRLNLLSRENCKRVLRSDAGLGLAEELLNVGRDRVSPMMDIGLGLKTVLKESVMEYLSGMDVANTDEALVKKTGDRVQHILKSGHVMDLLRTDWRDLPKDECGAIYDTFTKFEEVSKVKVAAEILPRDMLVEKAVDFVDAPDCASVLDAQNIMAKLEQDDKEALLRAIPEDRRAQFDEATLDWVRNSTRAMEGADEIKAIDAVKARRKSFVLGLDLLHQFNGELHPFATEMLTGETQLAREALACESSDRRLEKLAYCLHKPGDFAQVGFSPQSMEDFGDRYEDSLRALTEKSLRSAELRLEFGDQDRARGLIADARGDMCRATVGMRPGRIMYDLVSCGVLHLSDEQMKKMEVQLDLRLRDAEGVLESEVVGGLEFGEKYDELSDDEKLLALSLAGLVFEEHEDPQDDIDAIRRCLGDFPKGDMPEKIRTMFEKLGSERRKALTAEMQERIKKDFAEHVERVGSVQGENGEEIEVMQVDDDSDAVLLMTNVGVFSQSKTISNEDRLTHPEQWNGGLDRLSTSREIRKTDADGRPLSYISTSVVTPRMQKMAGPVSSGSLMYGFLELGEESVQFAGGEDLWTVNANDGGYMMGAGEAAIRIGTVRQSHSVDEVVQEASFRNTYSEVVLGRMSGDPDVFGGRIQPSYILVYGGMGQISDMHKKHAQYFRRKVLNPETGEVEDKPVPIVLMRPESWRDMPPEDAPSLPVGTFSWPDSLGGGAASAT